MGASASMDEAEPDPPGPRQSQRPMGGPTPRPGTSGGGGGPRIPSSRRGSINSTATYRSSYRNMNVTAADARKIRGASLGRKAACTVTLTKGGFSLQHIQVCEGQVVRFEWEDHEGSGYNITQVVHDGEQYRPVMGGFNSGALTRAGIFEQQFNLKGDYKFVSAGIRCTPVTVSVYPRKEIEVTVSDEGFHPKIIRMDEGNMVTFRWQDCDVPHTVMQVHYSHQQGTLAPKENAQKPIATRDGNYHKEIFKPGMYYFQTEGATSGVLHNCIVHVRERAREYRVEVLDRSFKPPVVVIQEGDRIWLTWDKLKCKKLHCPYQIDVPPMSAYRNSDESYKPSKNGFKWPQPTKSGLMSAEFYQPGVYYYSDHSFNEAAEYIGTVIVKPKQYDHWIDLNPGGFSPDLLYAKTGDRVWWTWTVGEHDPTMSILATEQCTSKVANRPVFDEEPPSEGGYTDEEFKRLKCKANLDTVQLGAIGAYHYRVNSTRSISTCSIISQPGSRNHTVHVNDDGFEPKVVTIHPTDRVWWIWQDGKKQHNIMQVSHQGNDIEGGFCSGVPLDCPSAYCHEFNQSGVYYYISYSNPKFFGAVVVSAQPQVHEVALAQSGPIPDPVVINVNDVVTWLFKGLKHNDVKHVTTVDQLLDAQFNSPAISPRRCLNRMFDKRGVYHYASKAFHVKNKREENDDTRVSSIIVDDVKENTVIRVDAQGFHPENINIKKGSSVLWSWKESGDECHNIIHVNAPESDSPLSIIQGGRSFNSGRPVPQNSFLYTFDEMGTYCVASQGAPGFAGIVNILVDAEQTGTPYISTNRMGGAVEKNHLIRLKCQTRGAKIYYTVDGSAPELHRITTKLYNDEKGIVLRNSGLHFVRAMACSKDQLNSEIFTSRRFWVLSDGEEAPESSTEEEEVEQDQSAMFHWWACVPVIKACFTRPGIMEVFWDPPPKESMPLIRGYQIYFNGVSYCDIFPSTQNCLNIAGLAGGRMYEVVLEVYPHDSMYLPHKSNKLIMNCPKTTDTAGPLISLETTSKPDMLAIVWISISAPTNPIKGYNVYLNGEMCGSEVVPDEDSDRCKVVIEGCNLRTVYRIAVAAMPANGGSMKMSNELEVTLPLDTSAFVLPPPEIRLDNPDLYNEYVEVREGSGYSAGMAQAPKKKKKKSSAVIPVDDNAHLSIQPPVKQEMATAAVPVIGHTDGQEQYLPIPYVSAVNRGASAVLVSWEFKRTAEPMYRLMVNVVNIVGTAFLKETNSDISFECLQEENGQQVPAVQHCWNVTQGGQCEAHGLIAGMTYRIFVVANYALSQSQQPAELQAKSDPIIYTTLGPPPPPVLKAISADAYQVTLAWEVGEAHPDVHVEGYRVMVDDVQLGNDLTHTTRKTTIDNLQPGRTINVKVMAVTKHAVGNSEYSNEIKVTCPSLPPAPLVEHQPSYKKGTAVVAWERPPGAERAPHGEEIILYRLYKDGEYCGEVKATATCNKNGYQYCLTDLKAGQSYDVNIKAIAGSRIIDPSATQVTCLCESGMSNTVPVMAPAPPDSPCLRLEGMHKDGIDITWQMPQQYGDAVVSGYQLLKDSKRYGSIMPPEVTHMTIKDVQLGERIELQILALTNHPVGTNHGEGNAAGTSGTPTPAAANVEKTEKDSGISSVEKEILIGDQYSACRPGPKLVVHYTGLVAAPSKVWAENVTGHTAVIVWNKNEKPRAHYVDAENFQVTWWPKDEDHPQINSQQTTDDHLLISGLKPNITYTVAVEARRTQKYAEYQEGEVNDDGFNNTFILTSQSDQLTLKTASPPGSPSNVGVTGTTCNSIQLAWDPPVLHGTDILGIRVDAVTMRTGEPKKHVCVECQPDARSTTIAELAEMTEYLVSVTAVTDEYFEQLPAGNEMKRTRQLPTNRPPPESEWLPSSSMVTMTSGTEQPTDVKVVATTIDSVTITWSPPVVHGTNRLQSTVIRWAEGRYQKPGARDDNLLAYHKTMEADCNEATIDDLKPGLLYKIVVEAIVSVKTTLDQASHDLETEKNNRRTTHVMSKPLFVRTRAPCEAPYPLVMGYTMNSILLSWEKPLLYSVVGTDEKGSPKYLKLSLEGYRLEINGRPHMRLVSSACTCTLVKCKPGKTYKIVLVALTCTEDVKKERKRKTRSGAASSASSTTSTNMEWETKAEDLENDESYSEPLTVVLPRVQDGLMHEVSNTYSCAQSGQDEDLGDVQVCWKVQNNPALISQFNVTWKCLEDGTTQKKVVDGDARVCVFPARRRKAVYDTVVEAKFKSDVISAEWQKVQCLIPGPPDPPEIWTKSIGKNEFIIEWGEPKMYGVKIRGYQVYLNGKKVGSELSSTHRKAVIPCKPKRSYRASLVALSLDRSYDDSAYSNTLLIATQGSEGVQFTDMCAPIPEGELPDDSNTDLRVRVVCVTENSIQLDWVMYEEPPAILYYRVTWSSIAQPNEREVKLPAGEKSCVLHKCYPGSKHFLRVFAVAKDDRVIEASKQLTVQTSAAPDTPVVTLRACNFRYIAIQWEKPPTYGEALITGYKVYVNGVVEAVLKPDQMTYSYTQGHWCREYGFQVQALTANEKLNSRPSDPLILTWPGVQPPTLRKAPSASGNAIKVVWDMPAATEGIKIKNYKVVCIDEATERIIQVVAPIHPSTHEAEIHNLKQGSYLIFLEVTVHGSNDVVKSDALRIRPTITPDPPHIMVTVIGLEERRQIEKVTCDLINKRDRLMNQLGNKDSNQAPNIMDHEQSFGKLTEDLAHVEDKLDDCLGSLTHYTGHLLAHVSWTCNQSNPDIYVSGYKVLVDGKQYGTTIHAGMKSVKIKLGLAYPSHLLSMVSVCDNPHTTSAQSNSVELLTEPFKAFTYFTYLNYDNRGQPLGGSTYQETLAIERRQTSGRQINQGLLKRRVAPPSCVVLELFEGEYRPLFPPSGPRLPTAILFWSKWNYAAKRMLGWFVRFARNHSAQYEFVSVACTAHAEVTTSERHDLVHIVTENGWRDDSCVRHISNSTENPVTIPVPGSPTETKSSQDVAEMFGVGGVPMLVVVHPDDYISWRGRYCAFEYQSYENFMQFVLAQVMSRPPPGYDPWDPSVTIDTLTVSRGLNGVSKRNLAETAMLIHRPTAALRASGNTSTTVHVNKTRPKSAKHRLFIKTNKKNNEIISVSQRPFSASMTVPPSPYKQKLITGVPKRRTKSGRKRNTYA